MTKHTAAVCAFIPFWGRPKGPADVRVSEWGRVPQVLATNRSHSCKGCVLAHYYKTSLYFPDKGLVIFIVYPRRGFVPILCKAFLG